MSGLAGMGKSRGVQRLPLPRLRPELKIYPGPASYDGTPSWSLHDPVRNRYFRLGWSEFEMLSRWGVGNDMALVTEIALETPIAVTRETVKAFVEFLQRNNLTSGDGKAYREVLYTQFKKMKEMTLGTKFKHYLFYRQPLIRPQKMLAAVYPFIRFLYARDFFIIIGIIGLIGLYLASRQMDLFMHTASQIFTVEGVAQTAIAIFFVKLIHEFAHAFTAYRLGCYVPTMGVSLIVGVPILYTDVSDSWRLRSRYQRVSIGAAGVVSELCMACIATFLWAFLPEGTLRNMCFFVATVSWFMSIVMNLNPLMRFDGYFIISDLLGVPNFGSRAQLLTRWHFHKYFFGLNERKPETFSPRLERIMIIYGYAVCVYRVTLYLGISLSVYHLFFKALGAAMLLTSVILFMIMPIISEVQILMLHKNKIKWGRQTRRTAVISVLLFLVIFVPWSSRVEAPAVIKAKDYTNIFPPVPARIESFNVKPGMQVRKGDVIGVLYSPKLEYEIYQSELEIEKLKWQISRQKLADDSVKVAQVLEENLSAELTKLTGFIESRDRLTIRAPFDGKVVDVAKSLFPGTWVKAKDPLAEIIGNDGQIGITAYVNEEDLSRIGENRLAKLVVAYPEAPILKVRVVEIDKVNTKEFSEKMLASTFGGKINVETNSKSHEVFTPTKTIYRIRLVPESTKLSLGWAAKGEVHFKGKRQSIFNRFYKVVLSVLIRESGF